ncbi:uncharacterized protein LOC117297870 isoform X1 [Asterias rubens]|uniref:uncharacterized protein LOC117297870 isoform X1 n=1 Tax=Asterias rubens TaxID=7604 RepID=UPI001455BAC2|nr:uncharacterized protein LOC117297870 isoform X1 [Asterias rubens]
MSMSLVVLNWVNRRRLIVFIFWYSLFMLMGMAYYSHVHVRWKDDSHLLRVYNSIFLPTPSPLLRKHYLKLPVENLTVPLFLQNMNDIQLRTARLKLDANPPDVVAYERTKFDLLELLNSNLSQFLLKEPSVQVQNLSNSLRRVKNALLGFNDSRTTPGYGDINSLLNSSLGNTSSMVDKAMLSQSDQFKNSSYLIAALEKNMQKIREETEISLKRLLELNEIINAPNETFSKDLSMHALASQSELARLRNLSDTYALNRSRSQKGSPETASSSRNQSPVPRELPASRAFGSVPSALGGSSVLRYPKGSGEVAAQSATRAAADRVKPKAVYRPPTPMPEVDGYYLLETRNKLRLRCKSCAVVSSSGQLQNRTAGAEIDSYPCVIRMNSAPISGYEDDVGSKTTARVMGHVNLVKLNQSQSDQHQIFVNQSTRAERLIIPWLFNTRVDKKKDKHYSIAKNFSKTYTDTQFYMLSSTKMAFAENLFQTDTGISRKDAKTWLSTGWMTLLYALDTCDTTDVFGLIYERFCEEHPNDTTPYHYYESDGKKECEYYMQSETHLTSGHVFVTEKAVFARWAQKFNLNFRYPSWNLTRSNISAPLDTPFMKAYKEAQHNKTLQGNTGSRAARRHHVSNGRSKKGPSVIGPKTKEDSEKEKYQRFTHAVMFIVAIFLSLVVFLLLFLLASLFVFCFYL